jgi:hypothetical protein
MRRRPLPVRSARAPLALALGLVAQAAGADELPPPLPAYVAPAPPPGAPVRDPITLDFGPHAGFGYRFSGTAGLPITSRYGGAIGGSIAVAPSPSYAFGLGYEHLTLGSEHGVGDVADVELSRTLDVVSASIRLAFLRLDRLMLVAQVGPGLAFQGVDASVVVFQGASGRPSGFNCHETAGPGLALRAGLGMEARINRGLWFTLETVLDNVHTSSDILGTCAPGAGTVSTVGLRAGFTYRLDVTRFLR